jgi:hypothetical protein
VSNLSVKLLADTLSFPYFSSLVSLFALLNRTLTMLVNKVIFTLACFAGLANAGQLRAAKKEAPRELYGDNGGSTGYDDYGDSTGHVDNGGSTWLDNGDSTWHDDYGGYLYYFENKAYDDHYLGYKSADNRAWLKETQVKFAYDKYWRLEKYDDDGKTGKCYEMDDDWHVYLVDCDQNKVQQKWHISKAPEEYGHYYTISNAYYGYVLEYDGTDTEYYLGTRDWKNVDYYDEGYIHKILFHKKAAFKKYENYACRTASGGWGRDEGEDYVKYDTGRDNCRKICSDDYKCKAWEYSRSSSGGNRCEIWFTEPKKFEANSGYDCYVKKH